MTTESKLYFWIVTGRRKNWGVDIATIVAKTIEDAIEFYKGGRMPVLEIWKVVREYEHRPGIHDNFKPGIQPRS